MVGKEFWIYRDNLKVTKRHKLDSTGLTLVFMRTHGMKLDSVLRRNDRGGVAPPWARGLKHISL